MIKLREHWKDASLDNVLVSQISDLEPLIVTIEHSLPEILKNQDIGVILIDSITWPFRVEDGSRERTQQIQNVVRKLHYLSMKFNVAVVCANHVADDVQNRTLKPCLGASWSKGNENYSLISCLCFNSSSLKTYHYNHIVTYYHHTGVPEACSMSGRYESRSEIFSF